MKRDRERQKGQSSAAATSMATNNSGKAKMWEAEDQQQRQPDAGMDELLAVLGYKVKSSDMADVAQKLEQLEMVMGSSSLEDGISQLSDTVHYNPSDLSGWVQSMLSELNSSNQLDILTGDDGLIVPPPPPPALPQAPLPGESLNDTAGKTILRSLSNELSPGNDITGNNDGENNKLDETIYYDDLRAIPGGAVFGKEPTTASIKRIKCGTIGSEFIGDNNSLVEVGSVASEVTRPVMIVDSQEAGVRLVHTLMACAEAVQQDNLKLADALVKHVGILAVSQAGAMKKVAINFAEALARRIYKIYPQDPLDTTYGDVLQMHFYETCPYLKFAHFTANQPILEAFAGAGRVHVVDFSLKQGMQWPALMQALALRPGGPPAFRLTGIGPPQPDNTDALQQVGLKLAQFAETIGVEFEFRGYVANSLADLDASMLDIRPSNVEVVAVNSVFELHRLLARPGAIEKVLNSIKAMQPKIVTVVEQEANHNGPVFLDRFNEALHYYSTMFDSLESSGLTQPNSPELLMSEMYLGRQIYNVVACEGADRVERHETLTQWRERMNSAGFEPVNLGSNAFKQASMLLALFAGGDGYRVEENDGCLMLGWHTRPLIATSAWQLSG